MRENRENREKGRGKFFVIEGIDGSGTTSISRALANSLTSQGIATYWTCEPSHGDIGKLIRRILKREVKVDTHSMLYLFTADRISHSAKEILPKLDAGFTVICDRYYHSTYCYQSITHGWHDVETLIQLSKPLVPDLTLILEVSLSVAEERRAARSKMDGVDKAKADTELYEAHTVLDKVRQNYHVMTHLSPTLRNEPVEFVDAEENYKSVLDTCYQKILVRLS